MRLLQRILILWIIGGCQSQSVDIPTLIPSIDVLNTSIAQTESAPPLGFRDKISFERIDQNLRQLEGWYYIARLEFEGVYVNTTDPISFQYEVNMWFNQISNAYRKVVQISGELADKLDYNNFEMVQLGSDIYLVQNSMCTLEIDVNELDVTSILAGDLIGGVHASYPTGRKVYINGEEAWEYVSSLEDIKIPIVQFLEETTTSDVNMEVWVSPKHNIVIRYYMTLNIDDTKLFDDSQLMSGELRLRYDVYDINYLTNIAVPFGC